MTTISNPFASALAVLSVMALAACGPSRSASVPTDTVTPDDVTSATMPVAPVDRPDDAPLRGGALPDAALPQAVAYRMSGPYADNIAVTLSPDGKTLLFYPAPSDLSADSSPLPIADGWYLSRCGITANSVFTRYTYASYRALPSAPTPAELLAAVIPGARVTALQPLPLTPSAALDSLRRSPQSLLRLLPSVTPEGD